MTARGVTWQARIRLSPGLAFGVYVSAPSPALPFPLSSPDCQLFALGRHALWNGVRAVGLAPGDEVLVPAYNCGAEVEALVRAGLRCRFFDTTSSLQPDEPELTAMLGPSTRALLLIHYLGFPQDVPRWRDWCDRNGLLLVEDCSPAWMARVGDRPVGSLGDVATFSLYKTLPLPDGAALVTRGQPAGTASVHGTGIVPLAKRHVQWAMTRSAILDRALTSFEHEYLADFALGDPSRGISRLTGLLLPRCVTNDVAERRRLNYERLLEELVGLIPPPFDTLPAGACPLALPLEVPSGSPWAERLARAGIEARPLWPVRHPLVPEHGFPQAAAWRRRFLMVPVHQELREKDLERMVTAVRGRRSKGLARDGRAPVEMETIEDLDEIRGEWSSLAERVGNLFATWEWHSTWWRHFGRGRPLLATACRDEDGRLLAVVPIYRAASRPVNVIRFLGHGQGDRLGPICEASDRARVANAIRTAVDAGRWGRGIILGEQLPADEGWGGLLGARRLTLEASPILRIEAPTWEAFLAQCKPNLRKQLRYQERRLARDHDLRYRLVDKAALEPALATLFALHGARWGTEQAAAYAGAQPFHREFALSALDRGWLRLWLLELDDRLVAAWHGFRFGGADWHYQSGRDPAWDRYSVGAVLLAHTLRDCIEAGMHTYHFLRGDEPYKQRFANGDPGIETIAMGRGPAGRAAVVGAAAARRLPSSLRLGLRKAVD